MTNIPSNPFPNTGTPHEHMRIDPIGYDQEIEDIRLTVASAKREQPVIINIYGEYGQGKTTFLKYLADRFQGDWENYTVDFIDFSNFDDLENELVLKQKMHEEQGTNGIFLVLDEGKHVFTGEELTKEQNDFLITLRKFADGEIDGVKSESFVLCLAMHPETKIFLKKYGHYDLEQRRGTLTINLKDLDYYTSYMIVKNFVYEKSKQEGSFVKENFTDYFDESFVNAFYALLSGVNEKNHGLKRFNGRTYAQIFFELFKYYLKKGSKLDFNDLKDILLEKTPLELRDAKLSLPNKKEYYKVYDTLNESDQMLWDEFVFNPKWHFDSDLGNAERYIVKKLVKNGYLSQRECMILNIDEFSEFDNETITDLKILENHRIFLNGEKILFFLDIAEKKLLNKLKDYEKSIVYRLDDLYLEIIYDFIEEDEGVKNTKKLIQYFKSKPSEKVNNFYELISNIRTSIFEESSITGCQSGTKYKFLDCLYRVEADIKHHIAIFYYTEDYANEEFEKYFQNITNELENSNYSLGVIFIDPYYSNELPKEKIIIRNLENRLFIDQINRKDMIRILDGKLNYIDDVIYDSIKLYTQECVKKGYTLPLTGFKMKIQNKPSLFREIFLNDIEQAWKIELEKRSGENRKIKPEIFKAGIDGDKKLINLARDSLEEFVDLDEYNFIIGSKLSKYEKNFINLFGTDEESKDEIEKVKEKYFAYYSRFDMEDYITRILKIKSILKEENGKYILLKPTDYLNDILSSLNSTDISELLRKEQDITLKSSIFDLKFLLDKINEGVETYERGVYNSEMEKIYYKIQNVNMGNPDLTNKIIDKYEEIKEKIDFKFGDISVVDVNVTEYVKKMENNSKLSDLYTENNIELSNLNLDNIESLLIKILLSENKDDIDRELLFALEDIINKIETYNIKLNSLHDFDNLKIKISNLKDNKIDENIPELHSILADLFNNSDVNLSSPQLKIIYQILEDLDLFIMNPIIDAFNESSIKYEEIKEMKKSLDDYKVLFSKLKTFNRKDVFLDNVQTVEIDPITIEHELVNLKNIAEYNLYILDSYSSFVYKNYKTTEIEKIIEMETEIKNNVNKDLLDYLDYIKSLNSIDYISNYISTSFSLENISENELNSTILEIKNSEEDMKNKDVDEIINEYLLPNGFLRRIIKLEEYYENGKPFEDKTVNYQIEGV